MRFERLVTVCSYVLGAMLQLADAATAHSMPPRSQVNTLSGTRTRGAPIAVGDSVYGTTSSGGPNCREPFDERAFDRGCGVLYRLDRGGTFEQISLNGRPIRSGFGALIAGANGDLYGVTAPQSSPAIVFRYSPRSHAFAVVHDFAREHQTFLFGLNVDRGGRAYVVGQDQRFFPLPAQKLYRVDRDGSAHLLHAFESDLSVVGPPEIGADGALYGSLTDGKTCVVYRADAFGRGYRGDRDACRRVDMPQSQFVRSPSGELYGLNASAVVAFRSIGHRRVAFRDRTRGERLIGGPVVRRDGSLDVLVSVVRGGTCGKILHIASDGSASTVTAFARSEGRCWGGGVDIVYPRLARAGDGFALTTVAGPNCGVYQPPPPNDRERRACGAVMILDRGGSLVAVHDFTRDPPVSDGGTLAVRVALTGGGDRLTLTFARAKLGDAPHPFVVYPDRVDVSLVDPGNRTMRLRALSSAPVQSSVVPRSMIFSITRMPGDQMATAAYRVDRGPASALYAVRIRPLSGVLDRRGEPLALYYADPTEVYVSNPEQADAEIAQLRERFVGKTVYGYGGSIDVVCSYPPADEHIASAIVSGVERGTGIGNLSRYVTIGLDDYSDVEFLDLDPIRMRFSSVMDPIFDGAVASQQPDPRCPRADGLFAGPWEIDRLFTRRSLDDHTEWSRRFRHAIADGTVLVGMTREMVAYMWGFPPTYGTVRQMNRLTTWEYGRGYTYHSVRFTRGRVTSIVPPTQPP